MPSAGQISFVFDQTRMRWMTSLTSGRFQPPLSLTEGNTVDFVFRLSNNGTLFTPPLTPVWIFGIKDANTPSGDFLIQVNSATVASGVYTFVVELASAELQTWLATATSQSYAAIQITDSANDIATAPLLCQIAPNQNDTGTTPTSANGTLSVAAGKTVTFPQSLTFPSALGTNTFQLSTDGAGTLTWTAAGGVTDGDKGDITVSNSGATWTIDNDVVGLAQLAHMATARVVGRTTPGNGSPELLTISGTGSVAMTTSPTFVTPTLGSADAKAIAFQFADGNDVISIGPRAGGALDYILELTNAPLTSGRTQTLPDATGTVAVAATTTTATHALFGTATAGAPAYRAIDGSDIAAGNIAVARIATALTTPGAIGGTTPGTVATTTTSLKGATSGVVTLAAPAVATTATLTFAPSASVTMTPPATSFTAARTDAAQTFTGVQTVTGGMVINPPSGAGADNIFIGTAAGMAGKGALTNGAYNTLIGRDCGKLITSGAGNMCIGTGAGERITTGSNNMAVGTSALANVAGNSNCVAIGYQALTSQTLGNNIGIGSNAGLNATGGQRNTFIGADVVATGAATGNYNTVIGSQSGSALTSGTNNVIIGDQAGTALTTGANNSSLGSSTAFSAVGATYQTAIGSGATCTANNQVMLGRSNEAVVVPGTLAVGGGTVVAKLRHGNATLVAGTVTVTDTAITANSRIWVNRRTDGGTLGDSYSITRSAGASFTITSKAANVTASLDTSVVTYLIIEP